MRFYILIISLSLFSGCTFLKNKSIKLDSEIKKSVQNNISKAKEANNETIKSLIKTSAAFELQEDLMNSFPSLYQEIDFSLRSANVSSSYTERASNLIGESEISPVEIKNEVLGLITNNQEFIEKFKSESQKESTLISNTRENDEKLKAFGEKYEKERNESIKNCYCNTWNHSYHTRNNIRKTKHSLHGRPCFRHSSKR